MNIICSSNKQSNKVRAINEQLHDLAYWLDDNTQFVVDKIKSFDDVIKLKKYCDDNNIEFFDNLDDSIFYTMEETKEHQRNLTELLGYSIF